MQSLQNLLALCLDLSLLIVLPMHEEYQMHLKKFSNVLWNDKRGHQLVTLKHIKVASTHSSFMLCQQNGMHAEWHKYYVDIKLQLN